MNTQDTRERITRLETNVETIMTNHLPHIQASLDRLEVKTDERLGRVDTKFWAIIMLLISTLIAVLINYAK